VTSFRRAMIYNIHICQQHNVLVNLVTIVKDKNTIKKCFNSDIYPSRVTNPVNFYILFNRCSTRRNVNFPHNIDIFGSEYILVHVYANFTILFIHEMV
jgi:hypothetical protein